MVTLCTTVSAPSVLPDGQTSAPCAGKLKEWAAIARIKLCFLASTKRVALLTCCDTSMLHMCQQHKCVAFVPREKVMTILPSYLRVFGGQNSWSGPLGQDAQVWSGWTRTGALEVASSLMLPSMAPCLCAKHHLDIYSTTALLHPYLSQFPLPLPVNLRRNPIKKALLILIS